MAKAKAKGGIYAAFKTSESREQQGVKLVLGASSFTLARAGGANQMFQKRLSALTKPHRRAIQTGNIDSKLADELLAQAYAESVIVSWEGVTDEAGEALPFNKQNALKLLTDLPDLFKIIRETAEDATLYREELLEADAGN